MCFYDVTARLKALSGGKGLSQFRKVRNAFECFVTQVQTRLPKTKCVWPMKINVICTVCSHFMVFTVCFIVLMTLTFIYTIFTVGYASYASSTQTVVRLAPTNEKYQFN